MRIQATLQRITLTLALTGSATLAFAHTAWLEPEGGGWRVLYGGHEGKVEAYPVEKLKSVVAYAADGTPVALQRQDDADGARVRAAGEAAVLLVTFGLTIFRDLSSAIVVGFALGSLLFIHRMSQATVVARNVAFVGRDEADSAHPRGPYHEDQAANPDVVVYRITGALFFGATASIGSVLDRIQDGHKALVVDFTSVPFLDSTGANMIEGLAHKAQHRGVALWLSGAGRDVRRALLAHGLRPPRVHYAGTVDDALGEITRTVEVP